MDYGVYVRDLDAQVDASMLEQVTDPARPDRGGFVSPADGMAGSISVTRATSLAYAYLLEGSRHFRSPQLVERIELVAEYGRRSRRPSGCFDLIVANFDSAPDTAFLVKGMAPTVRRAREAAEAGDEGAARIAQVLGELIHTAAPGIAAGGFHTPNHRWVIVAALSQAQALFPDLKVADTIEAYLAEGIDINEDGQYTERSTSVYNAVCNRALRIAARELDRPELLEHVRRNLDLSYHLTHSDATVVTAISTRQDRAQRVVPDRLIDSYYAMARLDRNGFYAAVADWLAAHGKGEVPWVLHPFLEHPEWRFDDLPREPLPEDYRKAYPASGLLRVRRGRMSATALSGLTTPFSLKMGKAELASVKLAGSYFGTGQFKGKAVYVGEDRMHVRHEGKGWVHDTPGYYHPMGRPVPQDELRETRPVRRHTPVPPLVIDLEIREVTNGFDLRVTTPESGMDGVPIQIECDFVPGGELDLSGGALQGITGQTVLLRSGHAVYHIGRDAVSVGPGCGAHRMWQMRDSEKTPEAVRVLITHVTPVDTVLEIRYGAWSTATGGMVPG